MAPLSPADQFLQGYLRHGMTPFFGLPLADSADPVKAYAGCRVVFLGVPHDLGVSQNPGARFAPYSVRRASMYVMDGGLPLGPNDIAVDGGNIPAPLGSPEGMRAAVERGISDVLAAGAVPFVIGGDHSVALPIMRAMKKKYGPLAVVHVDAHPDVSEGSALLRVDDFHHGAPIKHALDEGLIADGLLHQVGIRLGHDPALIVKHRVNVYGMNEIDDRGVDAICARIRESIGQHPTYVTFDIDAVDPAFAPGTGTPVPGGLTSREALRFLRGLAGLQLVGMDVVEVLPALDQSEITSLLAASLLWEAMSALPRRR